MKSKKNDHFKFKKGILFRLDYIKWINRRPGNEGSMNSNDYLHLMFAYIPSTPASTHAQGAKCVSRNINCQVKPMISCHVEKLSDVSMITYDSFK